MEANRVAFVSTVHVGDDPNGEGFGMAHYVTKTEKRLRSERGDDCAYGPRESCTIDTNRKFTAMYTFSGASAGASFGYTVVLEQDSGQRRAILSSPVRYLSKPGKGVVASAEAANAMLANAVDAGMTLVVSYWAGQSASEMAWLDQPCTRAEKDAWRCSDEWNEHTGWPWTCEKAVRGPSDPPACSANFGLSEIHVRAGLFAEVIASADPAAIAQGTIVLAAFAALAWHLKRRQADVFRRSQGVGRTLVPVEERPVGARKAKSRKGGLLPQPKKRVVSSAVSDDSGSAEASSDEELAALPRPKGKGKGKGAGTSAAPGGASAAGAGAAHGRKVKGRAGLK